MALQPCRECGRPISTEASTCPHCGAPRPTTLSVNLQPQPRATRPRVQADPKSSRAGELAGSVFGWIFGVLFALIAIGSFASDFLAGTLLLLAAAVVLPPVNSWLKARFNVVLSGQVKAWLVVGLIVGTAFAMTAASTRERASEEARGEADRREAARVDFAAHSSTILQRMDSAMVAGKYSLAISIGQRYAGIVSDPQFAKAYTNAQAGHKRESDRAKEQQLLVRVQSLPASDLEGNRDTYQQLVVLNPNEPSYKRKLDDYTSRIRQREAEDQDRIRRFGPLPQASAWDGSYREVKDYLKQVMNDPESLKMDSCSKVYHVEGGWLVGCDYRGRNAFGGVIRQSNWFIIRQGRVVEMLDASAYRP